MLFLWKHKWFGGIFYMSLAYFFKASQFTDILFFTHLTIIFGGQILPLRKECYSLEGKDDAERSLV
jgi:hypothetical protein